MKRPRKGIAATEKSFEPVSDEHFVYIAGYTEGGFPYGVTWEELEQEGNRKAPSFMPPLDFELFPDEPH